MKAIFFDANGVLYYRIDKRARMRAFLERHDLPIPWAKAVRTATTTVRQRAFIGAISREEYYDAVLKAWGVTDPALRAEGHQVQDAAMGAINFHAGVPQTLRTLQARSFKLGIVTNSAASTAEKLRWFHDRGLDIIWDAVANSLEVGVAKPDPRLYQAALEQVGVSAAEAVFVGHKASELEGARALGMVTVAFNPDIDAQGDYVIEGFADLLILPHMQQAE